MDVKVHKVKAAWKKRALIDNETYLKWYGESVKNPDKFWGKHGKRIDWFKPYTKVKNTSFKGKVSIKWFEDGSANVSYNCIDRHLKKRGNQVAIIWEGDNPYDDKKITYSELYEPRLPARQCDEEARRQEGRPRHHLHADDPGGGLCDARLHAHRRDPFDRLRRLLAGFACRPHRRLRITFVITADEGLRGGKPCR